MREVMLVPALVCMLSCAGSPAAPSGIESCGGFADWRTSDYVLPYPTGQAYLVEQGNCSPPGNGHRGASRFGYDFTMAIGTVVAAAREGIVIHVEESHSDGQIAATGFDNYVVIAHSDGTTSLYGHLTHDGADVAEGDAVRQGAVIGRSGNTGNTNNRPHLHFSVHSCDPVTKGTESCPSIPSNFRNTDPNPNGLIVGTTYLAGPI